MKVHDSTLPGFQRSKQNAAGNLASYYRLDVPIGAKPSGNGRGNGQHKPVERADEKTRHTAYTVLSQTLGLSAAHHAALVARGLSDEAIARGKFATLPVEDRGKIAMAVLALVKANGIKASDLRRVPGFIKRDDVPVAVSGRAGLLIPIMSGDGTIGGMVLRPDKPALDPHGKPIGKYQWLTSSTHAGPGAACSAHMPPGATLPAETVRLTEGSLKAAIAQSKSGLPTTGLPGVGSWRLALPALAELGAKRVRLAFDADAASNANVAGALACATRGLVTAGYEVEVERWDSAHKGIDDALVAGDAIDLLSGLDAVRFALDHVRRLGGSAHVELDQVLAWVRWYLDRDQAKALFADGEVLDGTKRLRDRDPVEFASVETLLRECKLWTAYNGAVKSKTERQKKAATTAATTTDSRPQVEITFDEHIVVDEALAIIKHDPALFQRGNVLVMVTRASSAGRKKGVVSRPDGSVQIESMPKAVLRRIMATHARWVSMKTDETGQQYFARDRIPGWAIDQLWDLRHWPGVRHLEGVIEAPTMRPDGSLLTEPGYDDETGLLYLPSGDFPAIPDKPSRDDAIEAERQLSETVEDFPFASPLHEVAFLAALLTPLVRFAIEGPCPLFLLDANVAASGKTKLSDIVAILATGREMPRSRYHTDDTEMDKTLMSIALAGDRLMLFDNVPGGFSIGGGSLDAALTGFTKKGRILGESRMSGDVPLNTVFYASGNNLGLRGDALRRVVPIRLESTLDRPEERTDCKEKDLLGYVKRERGRLVAAALTIVRAYVVADRPDQGLTPMDYPAWCGLVRNAVAWCTSIDPCKARAELVAGDEESTQRQALVQGFEALSKSLGKTHLTVAEMLDKVLDKPAVHDVLHSLFVEWGKDGKPATAKAIGRQLLKVRRRPIGGKCFDRTDTAIREWFLRSVNRP
jgi:hypothetical protein